MPNKRTPKTQRRTMLNDTRNAVETSIEQSKKGMKNLWEDKIEGVGISIRQWIEIPTSQEVKRQQSVY
jgi:hypothetical protein